MKTLQCKPIPVEPMTNRAAPGLSRLRELAGRVRMLVDAPRAIDHLEKARHYELLSPSLGLSDEEAFVPNLFGGGS